MTTEGIAGVAQEEEEDPMIENLVGEPAAKLQRFGRGHPQVRTFSRP